MDGKQTNPENIWEINAEVSNATFYTGLASFYGLTFTGQIQMSNTTLYNMFAYNLCCD